MANAPNSLEDVISKDDLESRYINENFRGCGAFGNVHIYGVKSQFAKAAQHQRIAVKTSKDDYWRADREIQSLLALLKEPHVVNIVSYSRSPSLIVMECCNCDLDTYIKQKRFNLRDLLKFWNEALHSLKSLKEKGILHRDVKPSNFLVDFRGNNGSNVQDVTFKLGDFGCGRKISKDRMDRGDLDDLTKNLGTNGFMSPEIAPLLGKDDCSGAYTYQSDFWSLSVTVFYIASRGKKPFTVQRLLSLHQDINTDSKRNSDIKALIQEHLDDSFSNIFSIIVECLKWNPHERYSLEKCLSLVEHLQKQTEDSALIKTPLPPINIPIGNMIIPQVKVPNESKVKQIFGLEAYDVIMEWCDEDSIKIKDILQLTQKLETTSRLHQDMKEETEIYIKHSTQIHCRRMFSMWYKMCGSDMSLDRLIEGLRDPALHLNGLAMELSKLSQKDNNLARENKQRESSYTDEVDSTPRIPSIVLLGRTGEGKSKMANILLGMKEFEVSDGCESVTKNVKDCKGFLTNNKDMPLHIVDTPGMDDTSRKDNEHLFDIVKQLQKMKSVNAFVWVMTSTNSRFTASLGDMLKTFELSFGLDFWRYLYIKVQDTKNIDKFMEKLVRDFPHSKHVDVTSNVIELDCSSDLATSDQCDKVLFPFYKSILTMGNFDCRDIDAIKAEGSELKVEFEKLKIENSNLRNEVRELKGVKYTNITERSEGNKNIGNPQLQKLEVKSVDQMLYVPQDVTVMHDKPSLETDHTLTPLELKKDNYLLTFREIDQKNEVEEAISSLNHSENRVVDIDDAFGSNSSIVEIDDIERQDQRYPCGLQFEHSDIDLNNHAGMQKSGDTEEHYINFITQETESNIILNYVQDKNTDLTSLGIYHDNPEIEMNPNTKSVITESDVSCKDAITEASERESAHSIINREGTDHKFEYDAENCNLCNKVYQLKGIGETHIKESSTIREAINVLNHNLQEKGMTTQDQELNSKYDNLTNKDYKLLCETNEQRGNKQSKVKKKKGKVKNEEVESLERREKKLVMIEHEIPSSEKEHPLKTLLLRKHEFEQDDVDDIHIENSTPDDDLSKEEQYLEIFKEAIDLATQKSASGRTKAINAICHALMKRYIPDFVTTRRFTICDLVERSLKKGKGDEVTSAAKMAVLLCLQLDDAEQVYKDLKPLMVYMVQDSTLDPISRVAVVGGLAGLCFLGGGEMAEVVKVMNVLECIFSTSFLRTDGSVPEHSVGTLSVHTAALSSWALLVTLLSSADVYKIVDRYLRNLEGLFSSTDIDLRRSAGETSALLMEAGYNYDEEFEPEGLNRSKKDRMEQRSNFRDILSTGEEGDTPREQVKFGREILTLDSWVVKIQYAWLCKVLGPGLNLHLAENLMIRQIFELGNPIPSIKETWSNRPSKAERNAANKLSFKWRTKKRTRNRNLKRVLSEGFL